jgi:hypothetical protein
VSKDSGSDGSPQVQRDETIPKGERHPLFGALKGFTRVPSGVDLTEPADPDWGKICEQPDRD